MSWVPLQPYLTHFSPCHHSLCEQTSWCKKFEWLVRIDWDDVLPKELTIKWEKWVSERPDLSHVAIPRCLGLANPEKVYLHLFSDAAKDAFASSAYLVCQYPDSTRSSRLIVSKCRVAPVKALTNPRLDLMGALLSSGHAQSILKVLTVDRTIYWTDSENVWFWVRRQTREFNHFVANRIGQIQRTTSPEQWRHVPATCKPADLPTRGLSAKELNDSKFWMQERTWVSLAQFAAHYTQRSVRTVRDWRPPVHIWPLPTHVLTQMNSLVSSI